MDELNRLLAPIFDRRLKAHIDDIDLASVSRVQASRFLDTALPNISLVELVSSASFGTSYDEVYKANFHDGQRVERNAGRSVIFHHPLHEIPQATQGCVRCGLIRSTLNRTPSGIAKSSSSKPAYDDVIVSES